MLKRLTIPVFTALLILTVSSGCKKDKTGNLVIKLTTTYNGQYFALDTFNTDPAGRVLTFQDCMFYLSNITLVGTNNQTVNVCPVSLFDISNPALQSIQLNNLAAGDFKGITFGCGVDSVQNNTSPSSVPSTNPLGNGYDGTTTMYWDMLKYRFEVMDGYWATSKAAIFTNENPLSYHIGGNSYYTIGAVNQSFSICCNNTTTLTLNLDIYKIFYAANDTISILTEPYSQSATPPANALSIASTFASNFSQAFTLTNP